MTDKQRILWIDDYERKLTMSTTYRIECDGAQLVDEYHSLPAANTAARQLSRLKFNTTYHVVSNMKDEDDNEWVETHSSFHNGKPVSR